MKHITDKQNKAKNDSRELVKVVWLVDTDNCGGKDFQDRWFSSLEWRVNGWRMVNMVIMN